MKKRNEEITLHGLWEMFLPKLWIVALVSVAFAAVLGAHTMFFKKDTYTSSVDVYTYKQLPEGTTTTSTSILTYAQSMIATFNEYLKLADFRQHVVDKLEGYDDVTIGDILGMVSIAQKGETEFFVVSVVSEDPELSAAVAQIICDELPTKIAELPQAAKVKCFTPNVSTSPDGKGTVKNALVGFVIGMVLSLAVIFVVMQFDVTIRSKKKLEENFDLPILGVIPRIDADAKAGV